MAHPARRTRTSQPINAPPEAVYAAFMDARQFPRFHTGQVFASRLFVAGMGRVLAIVGWVLATLCVAAAAHAQAELDRDKDKGNWAAPFGGSFTAYFTVASDYSSSGISNSNRNPVAQAELDYRSPNFFSQLPAWAYVNVFVSNVDFPSLDPGTPAPGAGLEVQIAGGFKIKPFKELRLDVGYVRHFFPGYSADFGLDFGEWSIDLNYNFGWAEVAGRVRYSPNAFGLAGIAWNKRAYAAVPLPFIKVDDDIKFKVYGSLGNVWIENFDPSGLPGNDYWYWQVGLVTSAWGLDLTLAYTTTTIPPNRCLDTANCDGRFFASITKTF